MANLPTVSTCATWPKVNTSIEAWYESNRDGAVGGEPKKFLIPREFGHAFLTLTDSVEFLYKADNYYAPEADAGIRWNDRNRLACKRPCLVSERC